MSCELSFASFDDARIGRAAVRSATAELRRLARHDRRVTSLRCRRGRQATAIRIRVTVDRAADARELALVMLRTSVHATGGATTGWNDLHVAVASAAPASRHRTVGARPEQVHQLPVSWAEHAAMLQRRARGPELPRLADAISVIDLR